jgi:lysozyme
MSTANANVNMSMSPGAKSRMRTTERVVLRYYNDMGKDRGHCTYGPGILAHRGVCTKEELGKKVSSAEVDAIFDRKVAEAERAVRRNVSTPVTQAQFDALVSLTFNAGPDGAKDTYEFVNRNDMAGAAANIQKMIKVKVKTKTGTKKVVARGLITRRAEESAPFRGVAADTITASK